MPVNPILLCHIAWMKKYKGASAKDKPVGGGDYPDKAEHLNYKAFKGHMYGFVAAPKKTSTATGDTTRRIDVTRLGATPDASHVCGVTVIWMADLLDDPHQYVVVGWYNNATVYRELQSRRKRDWYNIRAAAEECILIKPRQRYFKIPRIKANGRKDGLRGVSHVWFADSPEGTQVKRDVSRLICQEFDREQLETSAIESENALKLDEPPPGVKQPISQTKRVTVRGRDPDVWQFTLDRAEGICELCKKPAPFHSLQRRPYLEVHHVKPLADDGPDTVDNTVALCPNCHREAHKGTERACIRNRLRNLRQPTR